MTKKDFALIASCLAKARHEIINLDYHGEEPDIMAWKVTKDVLIVALKNSNPRFDVDRFNEACRR